MLYAELDAFGPVAIQEHESGDGWRVFFRSVGDRNAARGALASEFGNALLDLTAIEVDDEDWARRSQAALTAVRVGRIIVAPPWDRQSNPAARSHRPEASDSQPGARTTDPDLITIVIDPSTGFGTGHHASTRLCLELLQTLELRRRRAIDVGTGSGVLAIAAWKLGAAQVIAIDNDPDALANARENVARNGGTGAVTITEVDLSNVTLDSADLVIANLTGALLQRHSQTLQQLVASNGTLIVSGFTIEEEQDVARGFGAPARETAREGDWIALMIDLPPEGGSHM